MTYTWWSAVSVVAVLLLDLVVLRTRVVLTLRWWAAYVIICFFQLVTNGWLTGRGIVTYRPDTIVGGARITFLGDGRVAYAPVEDLAFGFALVLLTIVVWVRLRPRHCAESPTTTVHRCRDD